MSVHACPTCGVDGRTTLKPAFTSDYATANCDECGKHLDVLVPVGSPKGPLCADCAVAFGWEPSAPEAKEES